MRSRFAQLIKESVHGDFPEARKLRLAFAGSLYTQTIVGHSVVERVRPIRIRVVDCNWNGSRGAGVIRKSRSGESSEGLNAVVEVWRAEALDGSERDAGESIERDEVAVDFLN